MYVDIDTQHVLVIRTETDLQRACVKYLRDTTLIFSSFGDSEFLDTVKKRVQTVSSGYLVGSPDLLIMTPHSGYNMLAFEFKSPTYTGKLSENQQMVLSSLESKCNAYCAVINSYSCFVEIVQKYVNGTL